MKYVKHDGLYGEQFEDWSAMEQHLQRWLEEVANARLHGTTGRVPRAHYAAEEQARMRPDLTPACLAPSGVPGEPRKVDKTGLISFRSNKYSVPMAYQSGRINALATPDGQLHLDALPGGEHIASHARRQGQGEVVKNSDHDRDQARQVADLEEDIAQALGEALGRRLCEQLRRTEPQHDKDKRRGVKRHLARLGALPEAELAHLADQEGLTVSTLLDDVSAWEANPERFAQRDHQGVTTPASSQARLHLAADGRLTRLETEEVPPHGLH